jgi:CheY-like chemotaxis protein
MGSHATTATTIGALSGLSVLVVDDHKESLEGVVDVLQGAGAIAVGVRTANAAIGFATVARFDAVVVDLTTEDGAWFLRQLRESSTPSSTTPVFAISGDRHDRRYRESFSGYLLKPINGDALVYALAALPRGPQLDAR